MTGLLLNRIKNFRPGQGLVVGVPYVWLLLLFLIPFAIVLKISFAEQALAIPPYTPLYTVDGDMGRVNVALSYINYSDIFRDFFGSLWQMFQGGRGGNIYLLTYWLSIKTALTTTIICLLLGYPIAYAISRAPGVCVDELARPQRHSEQLPAQMGHYRHAAGYVLQQLFLKFGDGIRLSAVYGAAAVHPVGEARRPLARSLRRFGRGAD